MVFAGMVLGYVVRCRPPGRAASVAAALLPALRLAAEKPATGMQETSGRAWHAAVGGPPVCAVDFALDHRMVLYRPL
jgi:hypothetical protein